MPEYPNAEPSREADRTPGVPTDTPWTEVTGKLIRAAKRGDFDAWGQLDERYRKTLTLLVRGRIPRDARTRFDTEDLLQSAFLSAYKELDSYEYRGEGSFLRWLTLILENRLRGRMREHHADKRDARRDQRLSQSLAPVEVPRTDSPSRLIGRAEHHARLLQAIAELSESEQRIIKLRYLDEQPLRSVARHMKIAETTARRQLQRALENLLRKLKEPEREDR